MWLCLYVFVCVSVCVRVCAFVFIGRQVRPSEPIYFGCFSWRRRYPACVVLPAFLLSLLVVLPSLPPLALLRTRVTKRGSTETVAARLIKVSMAWRSLLGTGAGYHALPWCCCCCCWWWWWWWWWGWWWLWHAARWLCSRCYFCRWYGWLLYYLSLSLLPSSWHGPLANLHRSPISECASLRLELCLTPCTLLLIVRPCIMIDSNERWRGGGNISGLPTPAGPRSSRISPEEVCWSEKVLISIYSWKFPHETGELPRYIPSNIYTTLSYSAKFSSRIRSEVWWSGGNLLHVVAA